MIIIEGSTLQVAENNILEVGSTDIQIVSETTDVPIVSEFIQGPEGPSAYTIAKRNGFTGTEQEWLDFLKESAKQYALAGVDAEKGANGGIAPLNDTGHLPVGFLPAEAALKTDLPNLVIKEEGVQITTGHTKSINFTGAQLKATSDTDNNITVAMSSVNLMSVSASSSPGIVAGQNLKITITGSAYLAGSSIATFTITPSWTAEVVVNAVGNAATVLIPASGTVGDVLTYTVVATDSLGNVSLPFTKTVNVVTNSAPTGTIIVSAPTEVTSASVSNQISFTGLTDNDGTGFTYTIVNDSVGLSYTFSKLTDIADGEIVTFNAPNLGTNGVDTNITFHVKGVDSLGAETALKTVTVKCIMSHVIGVVLKATGGGGGTWAHVDIDGNDIATQPTSYFNSNPPWQLTDVTVDGQAMVRCPKFYFKTSVISGGVNNGKTGWWISDLPRTGFVVHPAFKSAGSEISQFYIGKYLGASDGTKLRSVSGQTATANQSLSSFQTLATARNTDGVTGFGLLNIWHISALQLLYLIESRTMASSSPYTYRNITELSPITGSYFIDGCWSNPTTGVVSLFDTNGNGVLTSTGVAFGNITTPYPVTFKTGAPWENGFFAATSTATLANSTAPNANYSSSGGVGTIGTGIFSTSVAIASSGGASVFSRLAKV